MDYEQLQHYQQSLLDRALTEGLRRNDDQTQTWSEYKKRHEKVIEALEIFPKELTVDCMVPIGKKALMKGKLTHTNEILISLGDGYFAEYSAAQAIDLCHRRIKGANDHLESLEKERNLYEMRQTIPDAFGGEERKDLIEHWDNEKLDDWRVEHRQREKEYRKKLSELRNMEKPEIQSENDLFAKLDALELQEELEAELHRLEAKHADFYSHDLANGEVYEESEESLDETSEENDDDDDEEEDKIDEIKSVEQTTIEQNEKSSTVHFNSLSDTLDSTKAESTIDVSKTMKNIPKSSGVKIIETTVTSEENVILKTREIESRDKKVVFGESQIKYFNENDNIVKISENSCDSRPSASTSKTINVLDVSDDEDSTKDEDDIVRIEFKHSDFEPNIVDDEEEKNIVSPRDIYRLNSRPKSILKNSTASPIREGGNLPADDDSTDEDVDDSAAGISAYSTIVHDIREHVVDKPAKEIIERVEEKRPVSKFKRERAAMKK